LNKILEQTVNSITVEPWLTTDELNEILDKYDLYFPVQLGSHSAAQIGGMIATNWAWMRAIKYWKMEKWVEEMEVITVSNKKEVKVQTLSWDDAKDFFWSEGTLGIILNAKLKLIKKGTSWYTNIKRMNLPVTTSHSQQLSEFCHFCFSVPSALVFFFF
jgi:FAD/FMN-containing dehydrogenase